MGSWLWCLLWFLHVSDVRFVFASYCLRYLCLYVHSSVFVLFFFVLCTPCCQFGFSFFITSSTLSTVFYLQYITQKKKTDRSNMNHTKTWSEFNCFGWVNSFCSSSDTRRVPLRWHEHHCIEKKTYCILCQALIVIYISNATPYISERNVSL